MVPVDGYIKTRVDNLRYVMINLIRYVKILKLTIMWYEVNDLDLFAQKFKPCPVHNFIMLFLYNVTQIILEMEDDDLNLLYLYSHEPISSLKKFKSFNKNK